MILSENQLILQDRIVGNENDTGVIVSWGDIVVPSGVISLPVKTEEQAASLKEEYLQWLYDLGKSEVGGRSLVSHLKIFENFSYWWLTSVAEKSPFLCASIFQIFKLRTLEKIYSEKHCKSLIYRGNSNQLHTVLKSWSLKMGHTYQWSPLTTCSQLVSFSGFFKKFFSNLPHFFQGVLWFIKKWFVQWRHVKPAQLNSKKYNQDPRLTIITFFPNFHIDLMKKGDFRSKYWEKLHDLIDSEKLSVDWVWFYFRSNDLSFKETTKLKDECNKNSDKNQRYFLLEEFFSCADHWKSFVLFLKIRRKAYGLSHLHREFCFSDSKINFFPIMKNDWDYSFFGIGAIEKIVWAIMFDSMAKKLPTSPNVVYTWENQTWERALVSALKRHQSESRVMGYEHSSVRQMDLRLFSDPRVYEEKEVDEFPIPDMLGVNSSTGLEWIRDSGYPESKTTRIEALRYFHLKGKYGCFKKPIVSSQRKLLIVTGILHEEAQIQIQLLKQAHGKGGLKSYDEVWIKPHPGLTLDPILKELKPNFQLTLVDRPLIELMGQTDVVYCANSSGVSLEAAWLGVPLIILAAIDSMNLNPLFGFPGQSFVKDSVGLLSALENPKPVDMPEDYFFLDENLKSWSKNLKL